MCASACVQPRRTRAPSTSLPARVAPLCGSTTTGRTPIIGSDAAPACDHTTQRRRALQRRQIGDKKSAGTTSPARPRGE
eukprot:6197249-Pleurochrysis_carterae.AAC.1